jgi:hypothetical protein
LKRQLYGSPSERASRLLDQAKLQFEEQEISANHKRHREAAFQNLNKTDGGLGPGSQVMSRFAILAPQIKERLGLYHCLQQILWNLGEGSLAVQPGNQCALFCNEFFVPRNLPLNFDQIHMLQ